MPKTPLSVTLDDTNLLWLKGRATGRKKRSLSEALDEILTQARQGGAGADIARSVVGTIDIAGHDPRLEQADAAVRSIFDESVSRPVLVRETPDVYPAPPAKQSGASKRRG
jgi:hypothetical protein